MWGPVPSGFTELKRRCLTACRSPLGFILERYRTGARNAFRLGLSHALFCLGCCWALMLVMFAAGVAALAWMLAFLGGDGGRQDDAPAAAGSRGRSA